MIANFWNRSIGGNLRTSILLVMTLAISACSQLSQLPQSQQTLVVDPRSSEAIYQERAQKLAHIAQWDMQGKIAINTTTDNSSGFIHWQQNINDFRFLISGPLGQGHLQIWGDDNQVFASTDKDKVHTDSINELFAERLGWQLPAADLKYWVLGLSNPNKVANININPQGQIVRIQQGQWLITLSRYKSFEHKTTKKPVMLISLPRKITVANDQIKLTLIIKQWRKINEFA